MPTDVIKSIGTGGDYSTIQAWEDASPADLTTVDQRWIGELKNQTFTAGVTISGTTVDATRYAILRCAAGASFRNNIGSGALKYDETKGAAVRSSGVPITISQNYTQIYGIQARRSSYDQSLVLTVGTGVVIDSCVLSSGSNGLALHGNVAGAIVKNTLLISEGGSHTCVDGQYSLYNCTIVRSTTAGGIGVTSNYNNLLLKNCAIFGFSTVASGTPKTGSRNNATDGTSIGGNTGDVTGLTYSAQFTSVTADWRALSTGGLHAGTPDATNAPIDIVGTTRDATTPYIGAWEVAGSGSGPQSVTVPTAVLHLGGIAPTATPGAVARAVPVASVSLSAPAPTATPGAVARTVPAASLHPTASAPTVAVGAVARAVPIASVALSAPAPTVTVGGVSRAVPIATLALSAPAPGVTSGFGPQSRPVPLAVLHLGAPAPTVAAGAVSRAVPAALLHLGAPAPVAANGIARAVPLATLVLSASAPTVTVGGASRAVPVAVLALRGVAPVRVSGPVSVAVPLAALALTARTPAFGPATRTFAPNYGETRYPEPDWSTVTQYPPR